MIFLSKILDSIRRYILSVPDTQHRFDRLHHLIMERFVPGIGKVDNADGIFLTSWK